jgi:hypothetical protein
MNDSESEEQFECDVTKPEVVTLVGVDEDDEHRFVEHKEELENSVFSSITTKI